MSSYDVFFDEQEHLYLVDGVACPSVTEIISPLHRSYGKVNHSILEQAAERGKAVHEALEEIDLDLDPEIDSDIEPYVQAYLDWKQIYDPEWEMVEQIVFCQEGWFIGTLDRMGKINGTPAIVDIKTSTPNRESYVSVCLQTMAYAMAYSSQHNFNPGWEEISRYGLFLMKDGTWRCINCQEWEGTNHIVAMPIFISLLNTHKLITKLLETRKRK